MSERPSRYQRPLPTFAFKGEKEQTDEEGEP